MMTGSPEDDFRRLNTAATGNLAEAAQRAGVRRFVYLSSLRAQADVSSRDILTEDQQPNPTDAYGRSKLAAEQNCLSLISTGWHFDSLGFRTRCKGQHGQLDRTCPVTVPASARRASRASLASIAR